MVRAGEKHTGGTHDCSYGGGILSQEGYSCCQIARKCRCVLLQKYKQTNSLEDKHWRSSLIIMKRPHPDPHVQGKPSRVLQQQWSHQTSVLCSTHTVCGRLFHHGLRSSKAVNERQRYPAHLWVHYTRTGQAGTGRRFCGWMSPVSSLILLLLLCGYAEGQSKRYLQHVQYLPSSMVEAVSWFGDV